MIARKGQITTNAPATTVRVAIYCRQSVLDDKEFGSIEAQREMVLAYVTSRRSDGWEALAEHYDDGGFTGANTDRPAFQRLMNDAAAGKMDVIAVYKLDRMSRSVLDLAQTLKILDAHDVKFCSATQPFISTTSNGRFFVTILGAFAELEREQIAERTRDKIQASRRRGMWTGGRPVLGYDAVDKKLVVNEHEAECVRIVFEIYVKTRSLLATAAELNARGIKTKTLRAAKSQRISQGRAFDKHSVRRILTNQLYTGQVRCGEELSQGQHSAIVDADTWRDAQEGLRQRQRERATEHRNKHGALLRGLLACGICGRALGHVFTKRGNRVYRYYACQRAQKEGASACPNSRAAAGAIEAEVIKAIHAIGKDNTLVRATISAAKKAREAKHAELTNDLARFERERRKLEDERKNLSSAIATKGPTTHVLAERLAEVEEELGRLREHEERARTGLNANENSVIDEDDLRAALASFSPVWNELFPMEQARVLRLLMERVTYDHRNGALSITFRESGVKALATQHARRAQ